MNKKHLLSIGMLAAFLTTGYSSENDFLRPVGKPLEAKAQRRQGGESFPPLPLPATPLRRSEKKRPPSPTALIGKVVWGSYLDYTSPEGLSERVFDWNMVPADCQQLLRSIKETMRLEYKFSTIDLQTFKGDPNEVPILFFSGGRTIKFTPAEREKIRKYILDGGSVWFDSVVGSPYFYRSAVKECLAILPESPVRRVDPDHAVFRIIHNASTVKANKKNRVDARLDGIYVGSRLAVLISPYGLGGGWDHATPTMVKDSKYLNPDSALQLGINMIAYALGWYESGQAFAAGEVHAQTGIPVSSDRIVFAQIRTEGLWNSDPGAETRFMRYLSSNLRIDAGSVPKYIDPASAPLEDYPFLYLGGIGSFRLSPKAMAKLKTYLDNGGFLFINNSLGMNEFDASVRAFVRELYPNTALNPIPADHPLFAKGPFSFAASGFSQAAAQKYPGRNTPLLLGVGNAERMKLVYSPVDAAGGWRNVARPGAVAYDSGTALRLGACVITYFLTH